MEWLNVQKVTWREPLACAALFFGHDIALLYSGLREEKTGSKSYLFIDPVDSREGASWDAFPQASTDETFPDWVGYLGYELGSTDTYTAPSPIALPALRFVRYRHALCFDHASNTLTHASRDGSALAFPSNAPAQPPLTSPQTITSNFSRASYEASVRATLEQIHAGAFYQANITRKFFGNFMGAPDSFAIFEALTTASPAPYSAYIRHEGSAILSASPECFLRIEANGTITTRPIKGSAKRGATAEEDKTIRDGLMTSEKNHAENLMIVDLMRNDLARVSEPTSVQVMEQSGLYSYATIHHLISTVQAKKHTDASVRDVVQACFPPGSMTGAPKIAAMQWCKQQEAMARGVYSGAIGWLGANGTCDLSVVIRTLVMKGDRFEFQVGGGIVADSVPAEEWQETLTKARGIMAALGISEADLAAL